MLKKIFIDKERYSNYTTENIQEGAIDNLNRINILIGANNVGKSRFLRLLFADRDFEFELHEINLPALRETLQKILNSITITLNQIGIDEPSSQNIPGVKITLKKLIESFDRLSFKSLDKIVQDFHYFWSNLIVFKNTGGSNLKDWSMADWNEVDNKIRIIARSYNSTIKQIVPEKIPYSVERIYVPILRGLRPVQMTGESKFDDYNDNYRTRTVRDYFQNDAGVKNSEIFSGLSLYQDLKKMLLGKQEEREKVRQFEDFLSLTFFNSQNVSLTPNIEDDSIHVSIGNEEWPIYKIGDGIQSLIILLYPLFFNQGKKLLIFIEEPENSLHPGLQRLFIETLMLDKFSSFQYFISTHSNHFLDITLDIQSVSVYSFKRIKKETLKVDIFNIENVSNENSQVLELIGARSSSVFLSNCTIWIEGITDRLYLKKYFEIYQNKLLSEGEIKTIFREDYNYSFVEYSGNNITHWSFADECGWDKIKSNRVSNKILLISDKDNTEAEQNTAKARRIKLLHEQLGENFIITKGREIENSLNSEIIIKTIEYLEEGNFSKVKFDPQKLSMLNYEDIKIGEFINSNFSGLKRKYKADSGTLYCKLDFCKAATDLITELEDLSPEAIQIAKAMFEFIKKCN